MVEIREKSGEYSLVCTHKDMTGDIITRRKLPHWYKPGAVHFVTYRLAGTIPASLIRQWRIERESLTRQEPPVGVSTGEFSARAHKQFFAKYDCYLDHRTNIDWLVNQQVAGIIRENLYHHDGQKYVLIAYSVMPNHVHVLLQPRDADQIQAGSLYVRRDKLPACPLTTDAAQLQWSEVNGCESQLGTSKLLVPTVTSDDSFLSDEFLSDEIADRHSPLAKIMHSLKSYTANRVNAVLGRTGQLWQHESYDHWVRDEEELERIVAYIAFNPVKAKLACTPHRWRFGSAYDRFQRDKLESALLKVPLP